MALNPRVQMPQFSSRGQYVCGGLRRTAQTSSCCKATRRDLVGLALLGEIGEIIAPSSAEEEKPASTSSSSVMNPHYVKGQFESSGAMTPPSWQIWTGFVVGVFPFFIASYEFGKRILIQRRCLRCTGSGLISNSRGRLVKCTACGGFFPWQSWRRFFEANAPGQVGNGGPLLQPKGQTSPFYVVPDKPSAEAMQAARTENKRRLEQATTSDSDPGGDGQ